MGVRKRNSAEKIKEARKTLYCAKLRNVPSSPRKMRYVADMVRGMEVFKALGVLKFSNKDRKMSVRRKTVSFMSQRFSLTALQC